MLIKVPLIILFFLNVSHSKEMNIFKLNGKTESYFKQTRYLKNVDVTLNSSGRVIISKERGIRWIQEKPFRNVMTITEDKIMSFSKGKEREIKGPMAKYMKAILLNLMKGHVQSLEKDFYLKRKKEKMLVLSPRNENWAKFVKSIKIEWGVFLNSFTLHENSGNFLFIKFKQKMKGKKL